MENTFTQRYAKPYRVFPSAGWGLLFVWMLIILASSRLCAQVRTLEMERRGATKSSIPFQSRGPQASSSTLSPQPFDVLHYKLDLSLALVNELLWGTTSITMVATGPLSSVILNAAKLQLDTVRVNGSTAGFSIDSTAETFTVDLNGMKNTGDTVRIDISYRRLPGLPRPSQRQGYYFFLDTLGLPANLGYTMSEPSDARFWMPCYDQPWDKATAEINVTVPAGYVAASNGRLLGTTDNGDGTMTWRWREDHQIATYLMCVTASQFSVSTLPYERGIGDTVPVQYYVWRPDSATTAAYLQTVREMIATYAGLYGPYPFDKYGMSGIIPFSYGGMEHQSITTLNRYLQTDGNVVCHELAHQWWGDLVTCGSWENIWLNESFATYSEALWQEHQGGFPALKDFMQNSLQHFQYGSWRGKVYDPVGQGFNLFDDVVYSKGAWVLHMLRGVVGDTTFFRILGAYRKKFAGLSAVTADFRSVVDSVAGRNMGWFFNEWIYGVGWPQYNIGSRWAGDVLSLTVQQVQPASWPSFTMPLTVRAYHRIGGASTFVVWDSLRTQTFSLPLPFVPDSVVVDPDRWVLKEAVSSQVPEVVLSYRLEPNYPNPFNPSTRIQYSLPERSDVTLKVFDILGREVRTLVRENQPPGEYVVEFSGSGLASGVYEYRLQTGNATITRKMTLVK